MDSTRDRNLAMRDDMRAGPGSLVSVVVPHYSDLTRLGLCLDCLERQSAPVHEIIVADNNSPEGSEAILGVIAGRARLVIVTEKGAGPARNGGAAAATGEVLAFTDSDCQPEPDWIRCGLEALSTSDVVGGQMTVLVDDPDAMTPAEAFETVFAFDNRAYIEKKGFSVTANLLCKRATFEQVGGFRVGVSEDVEWCQRAVGMGFSLAYEPLAVVGHPARRTWAELVKKWARLASEEFELRAQTPSKVARYLARSLLLPFSILAHVPVVMRSTQLTTPRSKMEAIVVLARLRMWRFFYSFKLAFT